MINVLVTAVGGTIGQSICKAIRQSRMKVTIVGVDMDPFAVGLFCCDKSYLIPSVKNPDCLKTMVRVLKKEAINALIVSSDKELNFYAKHKKELESLTMAKVLISSSSVINIGNDKWQTYLFLKSNNIRCPETALAEDIIAVKRLVGKYGYPLVIKPRFASGSYNFYKVNNQQELDVFIKRVPGAIVQQHIPLGDGEFTAASFCDGRTNVLGTIIMKRELNHGTTFRAELIKNDVYYDYITKIIKLLNPMGPCNIQFRAMRNKIFIIEINPRFSSTSCVRSFLGFNDVAMSLRLFVLGKRLTSVKLNDGIVLRYWNEVFLNGTRSEVLRKKISLRNKVYVNRSF